MPSHYHSIGLNTLKNTTFFKDFTIFKQISLNVWQSPEFRYR